MYCLSPSATLEQSLRTIWDAASQAAVLTLPPHNSQVVRLFLVNITNPGFLRRLHFEGSVDKIIDNW